MLKRRLALKHTHAAVHANNDLTHTPHNAKHNKTQKAKKVLDGRPALARYWAALTALPAWKGCEYGTDAVVKGWDKVVKTGSH